MNDRQLDKTYISYTYASASKRFIAYFIDLFILLILTYFIYMLVEMFSFFVGVIDWNDFVVRNIYIVFFIIWVILSWIYFTILPITSFSSTFGQIILKLKQIDQTGNHISFLKSNIKTPFLFLTFFSFEFFFFCYCFK